MSVRLLCVLALLGVLPASRAAAERIAVVEFRHVNIPAMLAEQLRAQIRRGFIDQGYHLVLSEQTVAKKMQELGVAPGCTLGPCLARIGQLLQVDRAITGGISGHGSSYDLSLTLLETGGGTVLAQVSRRCDVCNFKEVEETTSRAIGELQKQAGVYLATRAVLTVTSTPSLAELLVDGLPAGKTPQKLVVAPGHHMVEVRSGRERAAKQTVELVPGKASTLAFDLPLLETTRHLPPPRHHRSAIPPWLKWAALGTGVAVAGVGGALWGIDGREKGDGRYVHDTRTAGITLVSVGSAVALSSLVIYLLERRGERPAPAETTTAHGR